MKDPIALAQMVDRDLAEVILDPYPEWQVFAAQALKRSLLKKWAPDQATEKAKSAAALSFLEANYLSKKWVWKEDAEDAAWLLSGVRQQLHKFFFLRDSPTCASVLDSYLTILHGARTGPGSSLLADGQCFYAKLGSSRKLTATSLDLYILYRSYLSCFPTWEEGESLRASQTESALQIVDSSRMTFVPKNSDTERGICVEPSLNMFFQLGLEGVLRSRMIERWNLDLEVQPDINRVLARIGSRGGDFATLDLSSASDLISVELCRQILPGHVFDTLLELRVPNTILSDFGLRVDLGMISTMGNGFTFPLMTIILSCIVRTCYSVLGIPIRDNPRVGKTGIVPGNWGVFGDDIIVVREAHDLVVRALHLFGLQVNSSKSFNTGQFRESCGHDYFSGHDVRGVYLKRLASRQDIAIAVNLLNDWSYRTGLSLRQSVRYLLEGENLPMVPYADGNEFGVRVPSSIFRGRLKNQKCIYKAFQARQMAYRVGDGVIHPPRRGRRWFYNGPMLLLSLLKGELRNGKISVRQNGGLFHTRWRVTPWWDYMPTSIWVNPRVDWLRWRTAVEHNMLNLEE
jgi:hypothetical protein